MPFEGPLPTIDEFRSAFIDAVRAERSRADNHTGALWDFIGGTSAILWSREVQYVRDLFRAIYFDTADGPALQDRIEQIWRVLRILDAYGMGTATFRRPAGGIGETFHEGTRLRVGASFYAVAEETTVASSTLYAVVPIRATVYGAGTSVVAPSAAIDDELDDPTWKCIGLTCGEGTRFEKAPDYRARARTQRVNSRVGYAPQIVTAAQNAGAAYVATFPATAFGPSVPLPYSAIYVGDASYTGSQALINATILAEESVRALGAEILVGGMVPTPLAVSATVYLWDQPGAFDLNQLTRLLRGTLLADFYSQTRGGFSFTRDSIAAGMSRVSSAIQTVVFTSPSSDIGILTGSPPGFPASLPRYQLTASAVNFTFAPPQ